VDKRVVLLVCAGIVLPFLPPGVAPRRAAAQTIGPLLTFESVSYPANADLSAAIDLNDDNRPDIVNVFDNCPIELSVRMNTGARTLASGSFFEDLGCGPYPVDSVAVADANGDGRSDFLFLNRSQNALEVLTADGIGGLSPPIWSELGEPSSDFAAGDLDGDGRPEVVVTESQANAVVVYSGDGTGRFVFLAFARGGGEPGEVAIGDVDGDRDLDVVTLNRPQRTVTILLGDGRGRLTRLADAAVGGVPVGITAGDLNRDGLTDVIVTRDDPTISVFVAAGRGAFAARRDFVSTRMPDSRTRPRAPIVADLNGDGFLDVAAGFIDAVFTSSFSVLAGDGLGSLGQPESFAADAPVDAADLDADGRLDVVGERLVVSWNGAAPVNRPPQANAGQDVVVPESEQDEVALDAWRSTDPDGHALRYEWQDASGTSVGSRRRIAPFSTPVPPGTYRFSVTVDDLHGGRSIDEVTVTIQAEGTGGSNPSGPVAWTATVNVTVSGAAVTKTSGCNGCPDAGAISEQQISNGGWFEFVPTLGGRLYAGLNADGWTSADANSIAHAFSFWPDGGWDIREFGEYRSDGRFVQGDVFRIAIENFQVRYYRNNTLLYRSGLGPRLPARADTSFLTTGSTIGSGAVQVGGTN
jgi:hypothetical protein